MRRWAVLALLVAGCDDEIVGFASAGSSSSGTSTTASPGSSGDVGETSGESSSDASGESSTGEPSLGAPQWISYGFDAGLAVSHDDGLTWTDVDGPAGMEAREDLAVGEDRVLLVGGYDAAISFDGITWEHADVDVAGYARGAVYGSGGFAAVGLDHLAWSEDGLSWEDARGGLLDFDLVDVAYGDGRFVAVGVGQIATSVDGRDWTITEIGGEKVRSVAFGAGRFVGVGELGHLIETTDGVTLLRDETVPMLAFGEVHWCRDTFVVGGEDLMYVSPLADAWDEIALSNEGRLGCNESAYVIVKSEGLFRTPDLSGLELVHTPQQAHDSVHATGL